MVTNSELDSWVKGMIPADLRNQFSDNDTLRNDYQFIVDKERQSNTRYENTFTRSDPNYAILADKDQALVPIFDIIARKLRINTRGNTWKFFNLGSLKVDQVTTPLLQKALHLQSLSESKRLAEQEHQRLLEQQRLEAEAQKRRTTQDTINTLVDQGATFKEISDVINPGTEPTPIVHNEGSIFQPGVTVENYYTWTRLAFQRIPERPGLVFPSKQVFAQLPLTNQQVIEFRNRGYTVEKADFILSGTPLQQGIDTMNKIAERNTGIKAVSIG